MRRKRRKEIYLQRRDIIRQQKRERTHRLNPNMPYRRKNDFLSEGKIICYPQFLRPVETIIDAEDIPKVSKFRWHADNGYIKSDKAGYLAHFLLGVKGTPKGKVVDHINKNPLDNRKANLRFVSRSVNNFNCKKYRSNNSGTVGVAYNKGTGKWVAYFGASAKIRSKEFATKEEAIAKRKEFEKVRA